MFSNYRPRHHGLLCSCGHCFEAARRHPRRGMIDWHDPAALDLCARCGKLADHDPVRTVIDPDTGTPTILYCALD